MPTTRGQLDAAAGNMERDPYEAPQADLRGEPEKSASLAGAVLSGIALWFVLSFVSGQLLLWAYGKLALPDGGIPFIVQIVFNASLDALSAFGSLYLCARMARRREYLCGFLVVSFMLIFDLFIQVLSAPWNEYVLIEIGTGIAAALVGTWAGAARNRSLRRLTSR
jgi:hypothetical protein